VTTLCDTLTTEQLSALGAYELGVALRENIAAVAELGIAQRAVRDRLTATKVASVRAPRDLDLKAARIEAEAALQHCRDRAAVLKQYSSILQSLLRAATIV